MNSHDEWRLDRAQSEEDMEAWYGSVEFKMTTTCYTCPDNRTCQYAFDPYNTCGDCLMLK